MTHVCTNCNSKSISYHVGRTPNAVVQCDECGSTSGFRWEDPEPKIQVGPYETRLDELEREINENVEINCHSGGLEEHLNEETAESYVNLVRGLDAATQLTFINYREGISEEDYERIGRMMIKAWSRLIPEI